MLQDCHLLWLPFQAVRTEILTMQSRLLIRMMLENTPKIFLEAWLLSTSSTRLFAHASELHCGFAYSTPYTLRPEPLTGSTFEDHADAVTTLPPQWPALSKNESILTLLASHWPPIAFT
jgi:hypothetical protein